MTWLRRVRLALLVLLVVVLQTTVFSSAFRILGVMPDLALVLTIAVGYYEGSEMGAIYGFANGLAIDLFLQTPMGLSALAFALVGYGVGIVQSGLVRSPRWIVPLLGGLGGLAGEAIFVLLGGLAGQDQLFAVRSIKVLLLASSYDALVALIVFPVARWATRVPETVARGWQRG